MSVQVGAIEGGRYYDASWGSYSGYGRPHSQILVTVNATTEVGKVAVRCRGAVAAGVQLGIAASSPTTIGSIDWLAYGTTASASGGAYGDWVEATLGSPYTLNPGTTYQLVAKGSGSDDFSLIQDGWGVVSGVIDSHGSVAGLYGAFRLFDAGTSPTSGALSVSLPVPVASLSGTAPTPGALAVTMPVLAVSLAGGAPIPGALAVTLPVPTFAGTGSTPPSRSGYGLVLDSTATVTAPPPVDFTADPVVPADVPAPVQHVVVPTVPAPVLVNGRPS